MFHVSQLKKCLRLPNEVVAPDTLDLQPDLSYVEFSLRILERAERKLRNRVIKFHKVQWSDHTEDEATWEHEEKLQADYPELFSNP